MTNQEKRIAFEEFRDFQNIFISELLTIHKFNNGFLFVMDDEHQFNSELFIDGVRALMSKPSFVWDDFQYVFANSVVYSIKEFREFLLKTPHDEIKNKREFVGLLLLGHDFIKYEKGERKNV